LHYKCNAVLHYPQHAKPHYYLSAKLKEILLSFSCRIALQWPCYGICCGILEGKAMAILTVTARGQVTFRKDVLRHMGVKPAERIELELIPGGTALIRAARKTGSIEDFIGVLAAKTRKTAAVGDIGKATDRGWAGMR
jgi:antitoxin PrlF